MKPQQAVKVLRVALQDMIDEKCDYMRRNNLGDPDVEHTNINATKVLSDTAKVHAEIVQRETNYAQIKKMVRGHKATIQMLVESEQRAVDHYKPMAKERDQLKVENLELRSKLRIAEERLEKVQHIVELINEVATMEMQ